MMFEYAFGLKAEADLIRSAVSESMKAGVVTEDIADPGTPTYHTHEVGEWIVEWIGKH